MASFNFPDLPSPHSNFIPYLAAHPNTSIIDLLQPYKDFESKLREGFAQHPDHALFQDPHLNVVPIYAGHEVDFKVRARNLDNDADNQKYIFALSSKDRKDSGASAIVQTLQQFKQNFNLFSESSLVDLDWSNVVAAGSSVVTSLLPVPKKYSTSKRALREYYHQKLAPSSDVDLFIYGLDEEAAIEKIKQIETHIRNSILAETTTIRTKNAITIASQYPVRHVQIVARLYKSVSEILAGFDVDCSCFAYDGNQVYGGPRAIAAFMTQVNTVDLSRRSPSYESRLSKYSHRGFEAYWPLLERQRVDPTIFERSFARTMGLARLLVLETLPKPDDREDYVVQRRSERGRPPLNTWRHNQHKLQGNMKDDDPDDIAEWVYEDDIANYHTFTVPYGPKYNAKRIEKLLFVKDLLLNAEWNTKKDRSVNLHRHPCYIGDAESVLHDCCGTCPNPVTDEEHEVAVGESKIYVSGNMKFMKDDPGRQAIGSFNPLTEDDWTDMAYVGNTAELCQAISDRNLQFVQEWCTRETSVLDRRDHTGRTPLQLAVQCSSPEIVQCLIGNGARIVARVVDGFTALHIAAWHGNSEMVNSLLEKSEANEEEDARRQDLAKALKKSDNPVKSDTQMEDAPDPKNSDDGMEEDEDMNDASSDDSMAMTEGSFVKVKPEALQGETVIDEETDEPDIYDVNVLAWDSPVSPLHLAILGGHLEVIEMLISKFGADVLLPVKLVNDYSKQPRAALLTLVLAAQLSDPAAASVTRRLLTMGASSAQADLNQHTPVTYALAHNRVQVLKELFSKDPIAAKGALTHVIVEGNPHYPSVSSSLEYALNTGDDSLVLKVLELGIKPAIVFDDFLSSYNAKMADNSRHNQEDRQITFIRAVEQPVIHAAEHDMPLSVQHLLDFGADVNTLNKTGSMIAKADQDRQRNKGETLLDVVNRKIEALQQSIEVEFELAEPIKLEDDAHYLEDTAPGTYEHWQRSAGLQTAKELLQRWHEEREARYKEYKETEGLAEKHAALKSLKLNFESLRKRLLENSGQTFEELHPNPPASPDERSGGDRQSSKPKKKELLSLDISYSTPSLGGFTDEKQKAYLRLFEAVWIGDVGKVKEMTMSTNDDLPPLHIAVQDNRGFSPFSIAVCRGHTHLIRVIIDIANAQYDDTNASKPRRRYLLSNEADSDDGDSDNVAISSELVDETFTIDNIASLTKVVGAKVSAVTMMAWDADYWMFRDKPEVEARRELGCLRGDDLRWRMNERTDSERAWTSIWAGKARQQVSLIHLVIARRDLSLLQYLLRIEHEARAFSTSEDNNSWVLVQSQHLYFALAKGYMEIAAELIRTKGVELPMDKLVEKSGNKEEEKPRYYQGLKLYGKYKSDWAQERHGDGRQHHVNHGSEESPVLRSAGNDNPAAVEWMLSDTPARLYKQFCEDNKEEKRVAALHKAYGGFDKAIDGWLNNNIELSLHRAIQFIGDQKKCLEMVEYLIKAIPESLETKNDNGHTPLAIAFSESKHETIKALIKAGADQTTRDQEGRNILHLALDGIHGNLSENADELESLIQLIDKPLLSDMFLARCSSVPTGLTPVARWILGCGRDPEVFKVLLKYMSGEELTMLDGSGQRPLHEAVKQQRHELVELMIQSNPALLHMENAMGQTPLEVAESLYIRNFIDHPPDMRYQHSRTLPTQDRAPHHFLPGREELELKREPAHVLTWKICRRAAEEHAGRVTRKLVSVNEAREVAKRLAEKKKQERAMRERQEAERSEE